MGHAVLTYCSTAAGCRAGMCNAVMHSVNTSGQPCWSHQPVCQHITQAPTSVGHGHISSAKGVDPHSAALQRPCQGVDDIDVLHHSRTGEGHHQSATVAYSHAVALHPGLCKFAHRCTSVSQHTFARQLPDHKASHWHAQSPAGTRALSFWMGSTNRSPSLEGAPSGDLAEQSDCMSCGAVHPSCRCQQLRRHLIKSVIGRYNHGRRARDLLLCRRRVPGTGSSGSPISADCARAAAFATNSLWMSCSSGGASSSEAVPLRSANAPAAGNLRQHLLRC